MMEDSGFTWQKTSWCSTACWPNNSANWKGCRFGTILIRVRMARFLLWLLESIMIAVLLFTGHFADKLNPFTRFLIFLGTVAPSTDIHSISFLANPDLIPLHTDSIPHSINVGDGILIDRHFLDDKAAQTFRLEGGVDPSIRFSQFDRNKRPPERKLLRVVSTSSSSVASVGFYPYSFELDPEEHHHHHHSSFLPNEVCFKYMGYIGGDRMRRTDWFPNEEDIHSLRATIRLGCPENTDMVIQLLTAFKALYMFCLVIVGFILMFGLIVCS